MITSWCNARHADLTGERYLHIVLPFCVSIAAFILAAATTGIAPRYVAIMFMPTLYAGYVVGLAWICNTIPRPPAKRAAALAAINAVSNIANIYTVRPTSLALGPCADETAELHVPRIYGTAIYHRVLGKLRNVRYSDYLCNDLAHLAYEAEQEA